MAILLVEYDHSLLCSCLVSSPNGQSLAYPLLVIGRRLPDSDIIIIAHDALSERLGYVWVTFGEIGKNWR